MSMQPNKTGSWRNSVADFWRNKLPSSVRPTFVENELWSITRPVLWYEAFHAITCEMERPIAITIFGADTDRHHEVVSMIQEMLENQKDASTKVFGIDESCNLQSDEFLPGQNCDFCLYNFRYGLAAIVDERKKLIRYLRNRANFGTIVGVYVKETVKEPAKDLKLYIRTIPSGKSDLLDVEWMLQHIAIRELELNPPQAEEVDFLFTV